MAVTDRFHCTGEGAPNYSTYMYVRGLKCAQICTYISIYMIYIYIYNIICAQFTKCVQICTYVAYNVYKCTYSITHICYIFIVSDKPEAEGMSV